MKTLLLFALTLTACTADTFTGPDPDDANADAPPVRLTMRTGMAPIDPPDATPDAPPDAIPDASEEPDAVPKLDASPDACGGIGDLGTCSHSLCTTGAALQTTCDPQGIVAGICPFHPECCSPDAGGWSQLCVDLVIGQQAFACTGC